MALNSYSNLKAAIADTLGRSDLTTQIDDFIDIFEAQFNRRLKTQEMKTTTTLTTSSTTSYVSLPSDFRRVSNLSFNTDPRDIQFVSQKQLKQTVAGQAQSGGRPTAFALAASSSQGGVERLQFGPVPDSAYAMTLEYERKLTALSSSSTTNWLLAEHPDVYYYGTLYHATTFTGDSARKEDFKGCYQDALSEIKTDDFDKRSGGLMRIVTDTGNP